MSDTDTGLHADLLDCDTEQEQALRNELSFLADHEEWCEDQLVRITKRRNQIFAELREVAHVG